MRHGKKINHLGMKSAHRRLMLSNMAISLLKYKRINTTLSKAKALKKYIEPIITKSKKNDLNTRRIIFKQLQNKKIISELFEVISNKVKNRLGGYIRIIKTVYRSGDGADMAMIELVDFNKTYNKKE